LDNQTANLDAQGLNPPEAGRTEQHPERTSRNERGDRGNRPERGERRPREPRPQDSEVQTQDSTPSGVNEDQAAENTDTNLAVEARNDGAPREKRSRDRYGRERKPRGERTERSNTESVPSTLVVDESQQEETAPRKSYFTQTVNRTEDAPEASIGQTQNVTASAPLESTSVGTTASAETQPAPVTEPTRTTSSPVNTPLEHTSVVAPVASVVQPVALSAAMPKVDAYTLPLGELTQIATQSGLTWVNSDAEKVAAVQSAIAVEPKPARVPRERPPVVQLDDRPLVLVETRLDLRDVTLPFENTQPM
jgi:ribonuclease E